MAATLPHNARLKLEQALGQWRQWQCQPPLPGAPHIERTLGAGHSNWSVLVAAAGQQFVVRIDGINPAHNGINRHSEWRALQGAAANGLAPQPCYFNPELGVLVCQYLPPDSEQRQDYRDLAQLLRAIHQQPSRHQRLHLEERLARYEKLLQKTGNSQLAPFRKAVWRQLEDCLAQDQPLLLCHNDLLQANRLYSGGRLYALDWEYCAMASPYYELAVVCSGDQLCAAAQDSLLRQYLQRPASAQELQLLAAYGAVYRYLEIAWYLAQERQMLTAEALDARLQQLAVTLAD